VQTTQKNQLYYGDNLGVLREHIKDESVDLIYLDPPFNSRQDYNVLFAEKDGTRPSILWSFRYQFSGDAWTAEGGCPHMS
jgi:16S rRNA G966 N2-methylase RsmD